MKKISIVVIAIGAIMILLGCSTTDDSPLWLIPTLSLGGLVTTLVGVWLYNRSKGVRIRI